ncbi:hypothetical protein BKA62DRAFT_112025 [Auriculariales sp. MPI-PUGE-AT-0066]|nr:hypothetical protein BKA62DRAFT_112025 [Auriculariales sp. MPI-PUGE-AT-0066]
MAAPPSTSLSSVILNAADLSRKKNQVSQTSNPPRPAAIEHEKHHWIQIAIRNATQFALRPTDTYLDTGKYWPAAPPVDVQPFSVGTFAACNRDWDARAASGGTTFSMELDSSNQIPFSIGWTDPLVGAFKTAVIISHSAKDGYDAANEDGTTLQLSGWYQGVDSARETAQFRIQYMATIIDYLAVVRIEQVAISSDPHRPNISRGDIQFYNGIMTGKFDVEDYLYSCVATYALQPPPFTVEAASMTYTDRNQDLIGEIPYTGKVGPAALVMNFTNGVTITGQLANRIIGAHDLAGAGSWTKN